MIYHHLFLSLLSSPSLRNFFKESNLHKVVRFRKVHFATNIIDTAGMVRNPVFRILYDINWS